MVLDYLYDTIALITLLFVLWVAREGSKLQAIEEAKYTPELGRPIGSPVSMAAFLKCRLLGKNNNWTSFLLVTSLLHSRFCLSDAIFEVAYLKGSTPIVKGTGFANLLVNASISEVSVKEELDQLATDSNTKHRVSDDTIYLKRKQHFFCKS